MPFATADNPIDLPNDYNQNGAQDPDSVAHFIDSLFDDGEGGIRNPEVLQAGILAAAANDMSGYWLISEQACGEILVMWWMIWLSRAANRDAEFDHQPQQTDTRFFQVLADYVQNNRIAMFVPRIHYLGPVSEDNATPVYQIDGYDRSNLFFTQDQINGGGIGELPPSHAIIAFLELFATGAHIVVISSGKDLPDKGPNFLDAFKHNWTTANGPLYQYSTTAWGHSHYSGSRGVSNLRSGYAYPNTVTTENAPHPCPFVCSLLADNTSHLDPNTFFQLEGWPGVSKGGLAGRHRQDFLAHGATKWNISTYGASPFSEKRGTTVFLAPTAWQPTVKIATWPTYQGCKTLQGWYESDLISPSPNLL